MKTPKLIERKQFIPQMFWILQVWGIAMAQA